jgi:SAM-dependent methyltransferase
MVLGLISSACERGFVRSPSGPCRRDGRPPDPRAARSMEVRPFDARRMPGFEPKTYGDRIAPVYDEREANVVVDETLLKFLKNLAGKGPALEFGIGTGRVALPFAAKGMRVDGVDASRAMVAELRKKPHGRDLRVKIGNMASVDMGTRYSLVYVVFNTFFHLTTQNDQVRCFKNAAQHLKRGGYFVLETFFPDLSRFARDQSVTVKDVDVNRVWVHFAVLDRSEQKVTSQDAKIHGADVQLYPNQIRFAWPSELDLMARLVGLRPAGRYGGWDRRPFRADTSEMYVSVYQRAGAR